MGDAPREIPKFESLGALIAFRDDAALLAFLAEGVNFEFDTIGASREGRALWGVECGRGERKVSVIAGCHADEPAGPMTAQSLPMLLEAYAPELLDRFTFRIVPQMNPDGAARNRPWFRKSLDLALYLEHVIRELPGDDIEFGFGDDADTRPECRAAQEFLRDGGPYTAHYSLHGMGFAEGAWCLIAPEWAERSAPYRDAFAAFCTANQMPLHDIDRHGEKGFERIAPGFCTTPNSQAMRDFFLAQNNAAMAAKFRPSSMEWIASLGGEPLRIVSEMPLFQVGLRTENLDDPVGARLREELSGVRAGVGNLGDVIAAYRIMPLPFEVQVRAQFAMIVLSLETLFAD